MYDRSFFFLFILFKFHIKECDIFFFGGGEVSETNFSFTLSKKQNVNAKRK